MEVHTVHQDNMEAYLVTMNENSNSCFLQWPSILVDNTQYTQSKISVQMFSKVEKTFLTDGAYFKK